MANISNNRISKVLTQEQLQKALAAFKDLNAILDFAVGLTVEERMRLPKIDGSNKLFVQDALKILKQNTGLMPVFVNVDELEKDFFLYQQLDELLSATAQLQEKIRDTQMLAGSEAYSSALMAYRMFQMAADAGMPGMDSIVADLKQRFTGQGSSSTDSSEESK